MTQRVMQDTLIGPPLDPNAPTRRDRTDREESTVVDKKRWTQRITLRGWVSTGLVSRKRKKIRLGMKKETIFTLVSGVL